MSHFLLNSAVNSPVAAKSHDQLSNAGLSLVDYKSHDYKFNLTYFTKQQQQQLNVTLIAKQKQQQQQEGTGTFYKSNDMKRPNQISYSFAMTA